MFITKCFLLFSVLLLNLPLSGYASDNDSIDWSALDLTGSYYKKGFFTTGTKWTLAGVGTVGAGAAAYFLLSGDKDVEILAENDEVETTCNEALNFNVLLNDQGNGITLTGVANMPSGVNYSFLPDGTVEITDPGLVSFSFDYTIEDDAQNTAMAQVMVRVASPDFEIINDAFSVRQNEILGSNLLDNDTGEGLSIIGHSPVEGGQLFLIGNGDFTFSPDQEACGNVVFEYTVTDVCLREATGSATITIIDEVPPQIQCPPGLEISCSEEAVPAVTGMPTATDNCDTEFDFSYSDQVIGGVCAGNDTIRRTWVVQDAQENSASCVQTIVVTDEEPPVINCPADITLACDADFTPQNTGSATATDNCSAPGDITVTFQDDETGLTGCGGTGVINRTWRAEDACGNVAECVQSITFEDNTPPVIICPEDLVISCDNGLDPAITGEPSAVDNCSPGQTLAISYSDVISGVIDCSGFGTVTRTWTVSDQCGNFTTCVQRIEVQPIKGPLIVCPSDITVSCDESLDPSNTGRATATTDCDRQGEIVIRYQDNITGQTGCNNTGVLVRTWIATDPCGVSSTCRQLISVIDNEPPVINCPGNIEISCEESIDPSSTGMPEYSDNCTPGINVQITYEDDVSGLGGCNGTGLLLRTWTVTDRCGLQSTCVQEINIADDEAPVIDCPADITISCDESTDPSSTGIAQASDNCSSGSSLRIAYEDDLTGLDQCGGTGFILRTWTAEDACGFSVSCVQRITIADTQPPTISCPADVIISCDESPDPQNTGTPGVSDNCSAGGEITLEYTDDVSGLTGCSGTGTLVRTWEATDACGNTVRCVQNIRIRDNTPPVLTCVPDAVINCDESILPSNTGIPAVDDNCSAGDIVLEYSDDMGAANGCNGTGIIVRTWTATDACGNSSECTQTIEVVDNTAPQLVCPPDVSITCDQDTGPQNTGQATANDDCTPSSGISITYSDAVTGAIDCSGDGLIRRTWTATDACGNTSICVQQISITQIAAPAIDCPPDITISCEESLLPANTGTATATSSCSKDGELLIEYTDVVNLDGCNGTGSVERTWVVTDPCGLSASCVQQITVVDNRAPQLSCPPAITVRCDGGFDPSVTGSATVSDNCSSAQDIVLSYSDAVTGSLDCSASGTITRTWRAEDLCGNVSTCTQTITVSTVDAPAITCPADLTISCTASSDPSNTGTATATATCALPGEIQITYQDDTELTGCSGTGQILRTWTATDPCGRSSTCIQTITVADLTAPTINCPSSVTVDCTADLSPSALGVATSADNCTASQDIDITFEDDETGLNGCAGTGVLERTWTATDACGNSTSCVQTITIRDNTPPVLACPPDISVRCDAGTNPSVTGRAAASDNCSASAQIAITYTDVISGPNNCSGITTITRTWRARDLCGNVSTCLQRITTQPVEGPTVTCPPESALSCTESILPTNTGTPSGSTGCALPGEVTFVYTDQIVNSSDCNGLIQRTWTATDPCGLTAQCTQRITITDSEAPVLSGVPANVSVACDAVPAAAAVTASDNCDASPVVSLTETTTPGGCANAYTLTRTWTATDACGNSASASQSITVTDSEAPVLSGVPSNISVSCSAIPAAANVTATDNCDASPVVSLTETTTPGGCANAYTLTRTWTATDACGNSASASQTITVTDSEAPVLSGVPSNISVSCSAIPAAANVTATDNCDASPVVSLTETTTPGGCTNAYTLTRTWTATDACGNSASASQVITVTDTESPVLSGVPSNTNASCSAIPAPASVTATDNCDDSPVVSLTETTTPGGCADGYTLTRTWTATDACGNSASASQVITVTDSEAPVLSGVPPNISVSCSAIPAPANVTATDNCDASPAVSLTETTTPGGTCANEYTLTRTWTATDACGNSATASQTLTVEDNDSPILSCPTDVSITCLQSPDPVLTGTATATDACGGLVNVLYSDLVVGGPGDCSGTTTIQRTWTATDVCGNATSCIQTITLDPISGPQINCPSDITVACDASTLPANTGTATASSPQCTTGGEMVISFEDDNSNLDNCGGYILRTWTAQDPCGLTDQCTQRITLQDNSAPALVNVPSDASYSCDAAIPDPPTVTATDNCDDNPDIVFSQTTEPGTCAEGYTIVRTWTATDACGNETEVSQTITVEDTEVPVLSGVPADISVSCDAIPVPPLVTATDNCDNAPVVTLDESRTPDGCANAFVLTRTWTAEDNCGNSIQESQEITVFDNTAPTITCPPDVTATCGDDLTPAALGFATATDLCSAVEDILITFEDSNDLTGCGGTGTITRTWTAEDACGNSVSCEQTITLEDNTGPDMTCPPDVFITCGESGDPSNTGTATATDNCSADGQITITYADDSTGVFDCSGDGTVTRTWTAEDACGNISTCTQTIEVQQLVCPPDITISCEETTDPANTGVALAETSCATPGIKYTFEDDSAGVTGCGATGTIVRTWTMRDSCSLELSCPQNIVVEDVTAPEIVCPDDVAITCADDTDPANLGTPKASDNCSTDFIFTYKDDSVEFSGCAGVIERIWVAEDACGNTDTCIQIIKVSEDIPPPSTLSIAENPVRQYETGQESGISGILLGGIDYGFGHGIYATFTIQSGSRWLNPALVGSIGDDRTAGLMGSLQIRKNFGARNIVPYVGTGLVWGMDGGKNMLSNDVMQSTTTYRTAGSNDMVSTRAWYVSGGLLWKLGSRFLYDLDIRLNTHRRDDEHRPVMIRPSLNSRFIYLINSEGGDR